MNENNSLPGWDTIRANLVSNDTTKQNVAHWFLQGDADSSYLPLLHEILLKEELYDASFSAAAGIARLESLQQYRYLIETMADAYARNAGDHSAPLDAFIDAMIEVSSDHPLDVAPLLEELLQSERANVRALAAFLFGNSEAPDPAPLLKALDDRDPMVRLNATTAASAFPTHPTVVPALLPLLRDENEEVRVMVAYVLADLRDPQALTALQQTAKGDAMKAVRQAASHAIRSIRGTDRWLRYGLIALVAVACALLIQLAI